MQMTLCILCVLSIMVSGVDSDLFLLVAGIASVSAHTMVGHHVLNLFKAFQEQRGDPIQQVFCCDKILYWVV